ncbi:MAG: hypothetical protein WA220_07615 [Candidatus Nitrosopolaris sp.]
MNSSEHVKLAAFPELQNVPKVKRINDELLEQLTSSLRWLLHYRQKYNIPLPETDRILDLLHRAMIIADKLPLSSSSTPPNSKNKHVSKAKIDDPKAIMLIELPHKASILFVDVD